MVFVAGLGMFYCFLPSKVLKLESLFLVPNKVIKVNGCWEELLG